MPIPDSTFACPCLFAFALAENDPRYRATGTACIREENEKGRYLYIRLHSYVVHAHEVHSQAVGMVHSSKDVEITENDEGTRMPLPKWDLAGQSINVWKGDEQCCLPGDARCTVFDAFPACMRQ